MNLPPATSLYRVDSITANKLQRQLQVDQTLRILILVGLPMLLAWLLFYFDIAPDPLGLSIMMMAGAWMVLNLLSARAWQQVADMTELFAMDPQDAQTRIATVLRYRPLARQVRLLTYHRLATLRHQQQDYAQTIVICQSVLKYPLRQAEPVVQHLLLMLTEAQLANGDAPGAYLSLTELSSRPLSLDHSLQKLALQTRYFLLVGYHQEAVSDLREKVQMAEMMPALQCGAMHVLLHVAATHCNEDSQSRWLEERAKLLLNHQQYDHILQSLCVPSPKPVELIYTNRQ